MNDIIESSERESKPSKNKILRFDNSKDEQANNQRFRKNNNLQSKTDTQKKYLEKEQFISFQDTKEPARLVDVKQNDETQRHEFQADFIRLNRRWNRWQDIEQIDLSTAIDKVTLQQQEQKPKKRSNVDQDEILPFEHDEHQGMNTDDLKEHLENTKRKLVDNVYFGGWISETWQYSPLPEKFHNIDTVQVCEYCLNFSADLESHEQHQSCCLVWHPPGNEVQRDEDLNISVFEIDGYKQGQYCEQLGYISEMFLDHKNLQQDLTPFLFQVLCEWKEQQGFVPVGQFSKEKFSSDHNLSCIMIFPWEARKGQGKFLVSMSYELSLVDQRQGSPEKPLSDLGYLLYFSWWTQRIISELIQFDANTITLEKLKHSTGIVETDSLCVLLNLDILQLRNTEWVVNASKSFLRELQEKSGSKGCEFKPQLLVQSPLNQDIK